LLEGLEERRLLPVGRYTIDQYLPAVFAAKACHQQTNSHYKFITSVQLTQGILQQQSVNNPYPAVNTMEG